MSEQYEPVLRRKPRFADEPPPGPSVDELIRANGGNGSMVRAQERGRAVYLLPTGALIANNGIGPVFYHAPEPVGGRANLDARKRYWAAKLEDAEAAFKSLKAALGGARDGNGNPLTFTWDERRFGPTPGYDGKAALLRLRQIVREYRAQVAALDQAIADLPEERARRRREREQRAAEAQAAAEAATFTRDIESITLSD